MLSSAAALALSSALGAEPVAVRATPVALNPSDPGQHLVGRLEYRGPSCQPWNV